MKKFFMLLVLIVLSIVGYSYLKTEDVTNKGLQISNMQLGIGSVGNTDTFDQQKLRYDITISNAEKTELKKDSVEIVLSDWIKRQQQENKITEITFDNESVIIKGYVIFDTKGLSKEQIISHEPFLDGVNVVTDAGEKIFIKSLIP